MPQLQEKMKKKDKYYGYEDCKNCKHIIKRKLTKKLTIYICDLRGLEIPCTKKDKECFEKKDENNNT